jgi:hypothetical protein
MELFTDVDNEFRKMDVEGPQSNCSIEEPPQALSNKNIYTPASISISGTEEKKDKSMKYIADRFFPIRKTPCSAKDLFNDHVEWMQD